MKRQSLLCRLVVAIAAIIIISWTLAQAPHAAAADEFPHARLRPTASVTP